MGWWGCNVDLFVVMLFTLLAGSIKIAMLQLILNSLSHDDLNVESRLLMSLIEVIR